jgi:hypothetical protein
MKMTIGYSVVTTSVFCILSFLVSDEITDDFVSEYS